MDQNINLSICGHHSFHLIAKSTVTNARKTPTFRVSKYFTKVLSQWKWWTSLKGVNQWVHFYYILNRKLQILKYLKSKGFSLANEYSLLNRSLLTNVENKLIGKQRACKICYFHIISWWMVDSISIPKCCLHAFLYRISQILVSPASFAFLMKGTIMVGISTLSFGPSTVKGNLPSDLL